MLLQRDAVEEDFHIQHAVHGHTRQADIARYARMIGVVAAVGGQVESHR